MGFGVFLQLVESECDQSLRGGLCLMAWAAPLLLISCCVGSAGVRHTTASCVHRHLAALTVHHRARPPTACASRQRMQLQRQLGRSCCASVQGELECTPVEEACMWHSSACMGVVVLRASALLSAVDPV